MSALWPTQRPEVKRTYQSKFKLNKGPSLAESLLNRAVWAFDALWSSTTTPAPASEPYRARKSLSPPSDLIDEDDFAVSFGRLSIAKPTALSPRFSVSPQSISTNLSIETSAEDIAKDEPVLMAAAPPAVAAAATLPQEAAHSKPDVSKRWRAASVNASSLCCSRLTDLRSETPICLRTLSSLHTAYPWGCFLSDGAFKQVFKTWNKVVDRLEAVSVMNTADITRSGNAHVLSQEIDMGCLASRQVQQGLCVNFVQVFGMFYGEAHPDELIWGSIDNKAPQGTNPKPVDVADCKDKRGGKRKPSKKKALQDTHLYIAMELCDRGCVEDVLRVLEAHVLAAEASGQTDPGLHLVVPYMFQMSMSLAVTSAQLRMLHADVKLLNFMMRANTAGTLRYERGAVLSAGVTISTDVIVKLGDFGTSTLLNQRKPKFITLSNFTTFENTPPEYIYGGDAVEQAFSADAWCLGLCMLHMLTGCCPYEEVLQSVQCPDQLLRDLTRVWSASTSVTFTTLNQALACDGDDILATTLYRQCVLLGLPSMDVLAAHGLDANPVWAVLIAACSARASSRRKKTAKLSVHEQFEQDSALCSLQFGTHPLLVRCRKRLALLPHAEDVLTGLLSWFPQARPALASLPTHAMFTSC